MSVDQKAWSTDLAMPSEGLPQPWILELANMLILKDLPMGVIVGSAVIVKCEKIEDGESRIEVGADQQSSRSSILYPQSSMLMLFSATPRFAVKYDSTRSSLQSLEHLDLLFALQQRCGNTPLELAGDKAG